MPFSCLKSCVSSSGSSVSSASRSSSGKNETLVVVKCQQSTENLQTNADIEIGQQNNNPLEGAQHDSGTGCRNNRLFAPFPKEDWDGYADVSKDCALETDGISRECLTKSSRNSCYDNVPSSEGLQMIGMAGQELELDEGRQLLKHLQKSQGNDNPDSPLGQNTNPRFQRSVDLAPQLPPKVGNIPALPAKSGKTPLFPVE